MSDWLSCDHTGIGKPGCSTCDPLWVTRPSAGEELARRMHALYCLNVPGAATWDELGADVCQLKIVIATETLAVVRNGIQTSINLLGSLPGVNERG